MLGRDKGGKVILHFSAANDETILREDMDAISLQSPHDQVSLRFHAEYFSNPIGFVN